MTAKNKSSRLAARMTSHERVAVVTDSGCSIPPGSPEAKELGITIVPLEVRLWDEKKDQYISYPDTEIKPDEFYYRMRTTKKMPQTSGAVVGQLSKVFGNLLQSDTVDSIFSIHLTSEHSGAWASANLAKTIALEETPNSARDDKPIEIIDSKLITLAMWFLAEQAGELSQKGATLTQIKNEILESISKTHLFVTLETFDNLRRGGRAGEVTQAVLASMLSIHPIIGLDDGKLKKVGVSRSVQGARNKMVEMVGDAGKLKKVAVIHTNTIDVAQNIKDALGKMYTDGLIPIYEAGPALSVHAGPGAVGIAFQTK